MSANLIELGFAVGVTLAGPWLFRQGWKSFSVMQLIRNTPTARIRSMAIGIVEVHGTTIPRSRVAAPFTGRECVWWEVEVQTQSSKNRGGTRSWHTVHRASSGHPFFLKDETGIALVYPQGAECRTNFDVAEQTHGLGVPDLYMDFMESRNLGMRHLWAMGPMRFRERRLDAGAHLYVLGRANPKSVARTVSFDEEALEATGTDSYGAMKVRPLDEEYCAVIRRGPRDPAFILSASSERGEVFVHGLKAFGGLVCGPLLTLFGVWCLLQVAQTGNIFN